MKLTIKKTTLILIGVVIGLLGLTAAAVASDIDWPWSSEPGFEPKALVDTAAAGNPLDESAELQPDDNGYTGPVIDINQEDIPPSGCSLSEETNWAAIIPEDAPDQVDANADPNWSGFYYYHVPGSALRPRNSSAEWKPDSSSGGCLYQDSGSQYNIYNIHLDIPSGARIDYLRIYYYDTNSEDSVAWLTRYDGEGNMEDISDVESGGSNGFGTKLSEYSGHIVNNQSYSYVLNWRPYVNGVTMKLCGLRVAYRLP